MYGKYNFVALKTGSIGYPFVKYEDSGRISVCSQNSTKKLQSVCMKIYSVSRIKFLRTLHL